MTWFRLRVRPTADRGASAIEYALLIAAIGAVIIGVAFTLGGRIRTAVAATTSCVAAQGVACSATPSPRASSAASTPTPAPSASAASGSSTNGTSNGNNGNGNGNNGHGNGNGNGNSWGYGEDDGD